MIFSIFIVVVVGLIAWSIAVIPRAREWIARCDADKNNPLPVWAPPPGMESRGALVPPLDRVHWTSLSKDVDSEGVHVFDYDAVSERGDRGKQRIPANIAAFGIKHAQSHLETGDIKDFLLAARQFQYFVETATPITIDGQEGAVWCADFELGHHDDAKAPWRSAYFQIFAMNALAWGYALTGDTRYKDLARMGLLALGHTVDEGGLCCRTPNDGLFFEEVVSSPLHHILNGHLHTLIDLHEFRAFTGFEEADPIIEAGVRGTIDMLPNYDRYGYSLYSLAPNPGFRTQFNIANPYYHRMHSALLASLYRFTDEDMFARYADKWDDECGRPFDTAWALLLIMFRDAMRVVKSLRR
jgi:D-glucuronyl C5-epimerase C-terminus